MNLSSSPSSASGYLWIILTAFFWSLVGVLSKVCMAEGVTPLETAFWRAAVTCYLEPVLSTFWVWLFWQESFTLMGWLGSILVLGAVLLLSLDKSKD